MSKKLKLYGLLQIVSGMFLLGWLFARIYSGALPAIVAVVVVLACNVLAYRFNMSYKEDEVEETSATGI